MECFSTTGPLSSHSANAEPARHPRRRLRTPPSRSPDQATIVRLEDGEERADPSGFCSLIRLAKTFGRATRKHDRKSAALWCPVLAIPVWIVANYLIDERKCRAANVPSSSFVRAKLLSSKSRLNFRTLAPFAEGRAIFLSRRAHIFLRSRRRFGSDISMRWDPDASTATSYGWFVWLKQAERRSQIF
jgi:hypothetical protein